MLSLKCCSGLKVTHSNRSRAQISLIIQDEVYYPDQVTGTVDNHLSANRSELILTG